MVEDNAGETVSIGHREVRSRRPNALTWSGPMDTAKKRQKGRERTTVSLLIAQRPQPVVAAVVVEERGGTLQTHKRRHRPK